MVDFQERDTKIVDTDETDGDDEAKTGENVEQTREGADEYHEDEGNAHDESHADHHAHDEARVGAAIVTVSSTRSLDDDPSGDAIATAFEDDGHEVVTRELVRDSLDAIQSTVDALTDRADVDVVVTTGGTGVSPDDVTVEAVRPLLEKNLPGFGELFRTLSYDEIGTGIIGTRALGGVSDAVPVFVLPGSESAVSLATEEIILPEIGHLAGLATRGLDEDEE